MATFDEELQILLDSHPEIEEVRVKYKKGATFKPGKRNPQMSYSTPNSQPISSTTEAQKVAEMIRNGEL